MKGLIVFICILFVISLVCLAVSKWMEKCYEEEGKFEICREILPKVGIFAPIVLFAIVSIFNSVYSIGEQENAIVKTFGKLELVEESGIHFKIPYIQSVEKVNTTIQGMAVGYNEDSNESVEDECLMITSDYNFVNVDFFVEYVVSDPIAYKYNVEEPDEVFKNIVQASIRATVSNYTVDEVLTTGKVQIQTDIKASVIKELEEKDIGITLMNVAIQDSEPPTQEVIDAFKAVETAKQNKETKINEAKKYESEKLPANDADVDKIIQSAKTQKETRINEAKQQVAMFEAMYEEYVKDKLTTMRRMFFETMEEILPDLKVIIDGSEMNINGLYPIENFSTNNITSNGGSVNE